MKLERTIKTTQSLRITIILLMLGFCVIGSKAQKKVDLEELKHTVRVLKDIDCDQSKEWAISVLRDAAVIDSSSYAMNVLGLAYMAGIGVEKDTVAAISWLEKAGANGYAEAYHNLGMWYKNGNHGVKQDFNKAYSSFLQGADKGSAVCKYDVGYMYYKGLGCHQDYRKAMKFFDDASKTGHSPSLYMTGLCYRNGYGVEQDTARASYYLNQSSMLGFRPAMEELLRPLPENYLHELFDNSHEDVTLPCSMPEIASDINDVSLLYGEHQGYLVMYDWSGSYVLGEKPVSMNIYPDGDGKAAGTLILAEDSIDFRADVTSDGKLVFSEGKVKLNERYNAGQKISYKMDYAVLDIWKDRIMGRLGLYSLKLNEPERPMYIELYKDNQINNKLDERYTHVSASPNPFVQEFDASFELIDQSEAYIRIFDQSGIIVYNKRLGILNAGKHHVTVSPEIKNGTYVLNIKAGQQVLRAIIVKKG